VQRIHERLADKAATGVTPLGPGIGEVHEHVADRPLAEQVVQDPVRISDHHSRIRCRRQHQLARGAQGRPAIVLHPEQGMVGAQRSQVAQELAVATAELQMNRSIVAGEQGGQRPGAGRLLPVQLEEPRCDLIRVDPPPGHGCGPPLST
jgi:hypothetical protein